MCSTGPDFLSKVFSREVQNNVCLCKVYKRCKVTVDLVSLDLTLNVQNTREKEKTHTHLTLLT